MKMIVSRTTEFDDDVSPCDEAVKGDYVRIDERTTDDPAKIRARNGESDWWYEDGGNHRVEDGHIMRDFDDTCWFVEIPDLQSLIEFVSKYGECVIGPAFRNRNRTEIEIYDGYRE